MNTKKRVSIISFLMVILLAGQAFAISVSSQNALNAFRRYEPDFSNSFNRLKELDRRIINQNIEPTESKYQDIMDEAEDKMDYVQKRYDLMEDLFINVSSDYPNDRAELFDGFSRIDDTYKEVRNFYLDSFVNRGQKKSGSSDQNKESAKKESSDLSDYVAPSSEKAPVTTKKQKNEYKKVEISGVLKLDFQNRNEVYRTQTKTTPFKTVESALPNNLGQAKLSLNYKFNENRQLFIEDRFLKRERNEPVHENYLTASYLLKLKNSKAWTFKNTLHHAWYPDNVIKDYRDNLFEVFFNHKWQKRERLVNAGYQTRAYPNYKRSEFHQLNLSDQETWFLKGGNIFAEITGNQRTYRNINDLDYNNVNLYTEYNMNYVGNKADLSVSNTFDRRTYEKEAINLYRTSYYDNYFRVNYDLPVHEKLSYVFEGQYQKRNYQADGPRGYAQMDLMTMAKFRFDKSSRGNFDYRYIYNDENTKARAHKNHKLHGVWQKKINPNFKIRIDDTYHRRDSVVGAVMDFRENLFSAKLSWKLRNKMDLTWQSDLLERIYEQLFYRDYKFLKSGLALSYVKSGKYDWKVNQSWRKFSFRNGNNLNTGWEAETQPQTEVRFNVSLKENLKLKLLASWEKSYYRSFDSLSQELLWDFTRPMTITEFYGGLEYDF